MRLLGILLSLVLAASNALALEVILRSEVTVPGGEVTLADVAELRGDERLHGSLLPLELFRSPEPGQLRRFSDTEIRSRLERQLPLGTELVLSGASQIDVTRASQLLPPEAIEPILHVFLRQSGQFPAESQIHIKRLNLSRALILPLGEVTTEVIPSDPRGAAKGRFSLLVRVDGEVVENLSLRADLEILAPVVVAARDLQRGTVLEAQDLELQTLDIGNLRNPAFDAEALEGKALKRNVRSGRPLDLSVIEFPPTIARGDIVTIRIRHGALEITAQGEARQDGMLGEVIRVRNSRSNKDVLGVVVAPGLVELEY